MIEVSYVLEELNELEKGIAAIRKHIEMTDYKEEENAERHLSIPFVSQTGPGAEKYNNDCGAAAACMIVKAFNPGETVTPDEFYKLTGQKKDKYLSVGAIQNVLYNHFGIATNWEFGDRIIKNTKDNKLMIALINYGVIQNWEMNPNSNFRDQHYVVIGGYSQQYYRILDPLFNKTRGRFIPIDLFSGAWEKAVPAMGAIVTAAPIGTNIEEIKNYKIITPYGVNVRKSPNVSSEILGALPVGKVVQVYQVEVFGHIKQMWGRIGVNKWFAINYREELAREIK